MWMPPYINVESFYIIENRQTFWLAVIEKTVKVI